MALYGRDSELAILDGLTSGIRERGGALLVRGEPGVGKSTLLAESGRRAQEAGLRVLTTNGVESEARLPFAGLHQLIRPILGGAEKLPRRQRDALLGAFGMSEVDAPSRFWSRWARSSSWPTRPRARRSCSSSTKASGSIARRPAY
jgi:hypothetical protein